MLISRPKVKNFRRIKECEIPLREFTTFIGSNNCGKTTVVEALALLLGRDRLVRTLTEHDFHGSAPRAVDRIEIVGCITGFTSNEPHQETDWFSYSRGTIKWLNPETGAIGSERATPNDELTCQIAFAARFDHEALELVTMRYFYDTDIDPFVEDSGVVPVPFDLIRQVGFFLVPASRTWDRTISFGSELFRRVVSYAGGKPAEAVLAERDRLRTPLAPLEEDENLRELVNDINSDIRNLIGSPSQLKLRVTATDSESILESVFPHFSEPGTIRLNVKAAA